MTIFNTPEPGVLLMVGVVAIVLLILITVFVSAVYILRKKHSEWERTIPHHSSLLEYETNKQMPGNYLGWFQEKTRNISKPLMLHLKSNSLLFFEIIFGKFKNDVVFLPSAIMIPCYMKPKIQVSRSTVITFCYLFFIYFF